MSGEKLYISRCPVHGQRLTGGFKCMEVVGRREDGSAVFCHQAEKVEVVPVDAPNVLSLEEAELVVDRLGVGHTPEELVCGRLLWGRLSTWAEEQIDPDLTDDDIADAIARGILSVEGESPDV